ncbi:MAG: ABC-type multidrug transport system, ATPase component [Haloplasmataceae bacterium]|jgi:ABC-2 type transport system ATP-binding protein|nr:ABC-type multidrug transport system, ATPase component [Haloplasmataceae bacterium]
MNVIEVKNLIKKYKNFTAVDHISLEVEEGCIFGMLGPNGAGKTTTIECIIGLKNRDGGEVNVLGIDPNVDYKKLYNLIGVQLQETSYQDKIKVYEICELFTSMYENPVDYHILLDRFGLHDKAKSYLSQLSGGQRQKIAIILALISNPKLVFLDELTTGLDPKSRREMWDYIKELKNEGRTVFMTTHYMEEAAYLCDKICIINDGKIIALDTVDGVIDLADIDQVISFETEEDIVQLIEKEIKGINKIEKENKKLKIYSKREDLLTDLVIFLKEKSIKYRKIDINRPGLEDAFIKLTEKTRKVE